MLSKIARLRSELDIVRGNCKVMSEMLTEMVPGQEDASDLELLQVLKLSVFPFCFQLVFKSPECTTRGSRSTVYINRHFNGLLFLHRIGLFFFLLVL